MIHRKRNNQRKVKSLILPFQQLLRKPVFIFVFIIISFVNTGCDLFFSDPKQILYRPQTLKIEDPSGHSLSKLPLPLRLQSPQLTKKLNVSAMIDSQWGKDPGQEGVTELFSDQEVPYLGGDNCLNSIFFDSLGIPYSTDSSPIYQSTNFYNHLEVFVKEPVNYFFYNHHLFLEEGTYPYYSKNNQFIVGEKFITQGTNKALDEFYNERSRYYERIFKGKISTFKIHCQYPAQIMGSAKEDVELQMMESDKSLIFLANKEIHLFLRKDQIMRYVSEFMISKEYFHL